MSGKHWQLQIAEKSLKKREKLNVLNKYLKTGSSERILDLGCAQGIISYYLRQKPGFWVSADSDLSNLHSARELIPGGLVQLEGARLPFRSQSLDHVISLDFLEHLDDDDACLQEIRRVLKPGGCLLMAVPRTGRIFFLHRLRPRLGMTLDVYGHKREGYTLQDMRQKLKDAGLTFIRHKRFSGFFTEAVELLLNVFYTRFLAPRQKRKLRDGHIRPADAEEFNSRKKIIRAYTLIHPVIWLFTRLDRLFFFQRGYALMVWAGK